MKEYQMIDTSILLDILSKHAEDYTKMMHGETIEKDFKILKATIDTIQSELNARHQDRRKTA